MVTVEQAQAQQKIQLESNAKAYASFNAAASGSFGSYDSMSDAGKAAYDKGLSDSGYFQVGGYLQKKSTPLKNPFDTSDQNYKTGSKGQPAPSPKSMATFEKDPVYQFTKRRGEPFSSKGYTNISTYQPKQGVIELANRTPNYYGGTSGKDKINNRLLEEQQINRKANLEQGIRFAAITNARSAYDLFEPNTYTYKKPYKDNIKVAKPTFTEREGIDKAAARIEKQGLPPIMVGKLVGSRANTISFADVEEYKQPKIFATGRKALSQETATKIEARRAAAKEALQNKQLFGQPTVSRTEKFGTGSSSIDMYGNIATTKTLGTKTSSYKPAIATATKIAEMKDRAFPLTLRELGAQKTKIQTTKSKQISTSPYDFTDPRTIDYAGDQYNRRDETVVINAPAIPLAGRNAGYLEQISRAGQRAGYNYLADTLNIVPTVVELAGGKAPYKFKPIESPARQYMIGESEKIFGNKKTGEYTQAQANIRREESPLESDIELGLSSFGTGVDIGSIFGGGVKGGIKLAKVGKSSFGKIVENIVNVELKKKDKVVLENARRLAKQETKERKAAFLEDVPRSEFEKQKPLYEIETGKYKGTKGVAEILSPKGKLSVNLEDLTGRSPLTAKTKFQTIEETRGLSPEDFVKKSKKKGKAPFDEESDYTRRYMSNEGEPSGTTYKGGGSDAGLQASMRTSKGTRQILVNPNEEIGKLGKGKSTDLAKIFGTSSGFAASVFLLPKQEQETPFSFEGLTGGKSKQTLENPFDLGQKEKQSRKPNQGLIQIPKEEIEEKSGILFLPTFDTPQAQKYGYKTAFDFPPFNPTRTTTTPAYDFGQLPKLQEKQLTRQKPIFEPIPTGRLRFGDGGSSVSDFTTDWDKFYRVYDTAKQPFGKVKVGLGYFQDKQFEFFEIMGKGKGRRVSKFYDYY